MLSKVRRSSASGLLLMVLAEGVAVSAPAAERTHAEKEWAFPSGLTVNLFEDRRAPLVRVALVMPLGTADAPSDQKSLAHLVEHLAFRQPTDGVTLWDQLRDAGCTVDASTRTDITTYGWTCPATARKLAIHSALVIAERRLEGVSDEVLAAEVSVLAHESGFRDTFFARPVYDAMFRELFPAPHRYTLPPADFDETPVSADDVRRFLASPKDPARETVLAIGGDLAPGDLAEILTSFPRPSVFADGLTSEHVRSFPSQELASFPRTEIPCPWFVQPDAPEQPLRSRRTEAMFRDPSSPTYWASPVHVTVEAGLHHTLMLAWRLPAADARSNPRLERLVDMTTADLQHAAPKRPGVEARGCDVIGGIESSVLFCSIDVSPWVHMEALAEELGDTFVRPWTLEREAAVADGTRDERRAPLLNRRMDDASLTELMARAVARQTAGISTWISTTASGSRAGELAAYQEWAAAWLQPRMAVSVSARPGSRAAMSSSPPAPTEALVRPVASPPDPSWTLDMPPRDPSVYTLPNGLTVVQIASESYGGTIWSLVSPTARADRIVSPSLAVSLVSPDKVDGNKLKYTIRPSTVHGAVVLRAAQRGVWAPRHLLRAFWGTVQAPRIAGVAKATERHILTWARASDRASAWAHLPARAAWTRQPLDTMDALDGFSSRPVSSVAAKAWASRVLRPETSTLLVVGNYDAKSEEHILEELNDWTTTSPAPAAAPDLPERQVDFAPQLWVLDEPTWTLAHVAVTCPLRGVPGAARAPDVLGEITFRRAWDTVRAANGATYTPSAGVQTRDGGHDLTVSALTTPEAAPAMVRSLRAVLASLANGVGEDETRVARVGLVTALAQRRASVMAVSTDLTDGLARGESIASLLSLPNDVLGVTPEQVAATAAPCRDATVAVVLGPAERVEGALNQAGMSPERYDWAAAYERALRTHAPAALKQLQKEQAKALAAERNTP